MEEDSVVTITPYCCLSDERCLNLSRQPVMQEDYSLPYLVSVKLEIFLIVPHGIFVVL